MLSNGPQNSNRSIWLERTLTWIGFPLAKVASVPPTQWLARTVALQQKSVVKQSGQISFKHAFRQIYAQGWQSLFQGTILSMQRELWKSSYKGGLQVYTLSGSAWLISHSSLQGSSHTLAIDLLAGGTTGVVDAVLGSPVERIKQLMVSSNRGQYSFLGFVKQIRAENMIREELYRGLGPTVVKQSIMMSTLNVTRRKVNKLVAPYQEEHPYLTAITASVIPGACAALAGAPADVVKTLTQMDIGVKTSSTALIRQVVKQSGWKGLLAGTPGKVMLGTVGYTLNAAFLNGMDYLFPKDSSSSKPPSISAPSSPTQISNSDTNVSQEILEVVKRLNNLLLSFSVSSQKDTLDPINSITTEFNRMKINNNFQENENNRSEMPTSIDFSSEPKNENKISL